MRDLSPVCSTAVGPQGELEGLNEQQMLGGAVAHSAAGTLAGQIGPWGQTRFEVAEYGQQAQGYRRLRLWARGCEEIHGWAWG